MTALFFVAQLVDFDGERIHVNQTPEKCPPDTSLMWDPLEITCFNPCHTEYLKLCTSQCEHLGH